MSWTAWAEKINLFIISIEKFAQNIASEVLHQREEMRRKSKPKMLKYLFRLLSLCNAAFFVNLNINCIIFMNFISKHCICVELVLLFFCAYFKLKSCVMQLLLWFHLNNEYIWCLLASTITFYSLLHHKDNYLHKELLMTICVSRVPNLWILWRKKN